MCIYVCIYQRKCILHRLYPYHTCTCNTYVSIVHVFTTYYSYRVVYPRLLLLWLPLILTLCPLRGGTRQSSVFRSSSTRSSSPPLPLMGPAPRFIPSVSLYRAVKGLRYLNSETRYMNLHYQSNQVR